MYVCTVKPLYADTLIAFFCLSQWNITSPIKSVHIWGFHCCLQMKPAHRGEWGTNFIAITKTRETTDTQTRDSLQPTANLAKPMLAQRAAMMPRANAGAATAAMAPLYSFGESSDTWIGGTNSIILMREVKISQFLPLRHWYATVYTMYYTWIHCMLYGDNT